jgi:cation transport protein ChaC
MPVPADVWIFAYGSIMWNPGFAYRKVHRALLRGYHRTFCVYSTHYRGTHERPGLVFGLDRGGSCRGRVFRVCAADAPAVIATLDERENVYDVYSRRTLRVITPKGPVFAESYVVDREGPQYAGKLPVARVLELLRESGTGGTGVEYLENTVRHLDKLGIPDTRLHELLCALER